MNQEVNVPVLNNNSDSEPDKKEEKKVVKSIFENEEYKEKVESKLEPLKIEELFFGNGKLLQTVNIYPNLSVTFSTIETGVDCLIDKICYEHSQDNQNPMRISALANLSAGLIAINGKTVVPGVPEVLYSAENPDKYYEYLTKKLDLIKSMNLNVINLLYLHYRWFLDRVNLILNEKLVESIENF